MYKLYWIHLPTHFDPLKDGYIGITKQSLHQRMYDHRVRLKEHFENGAIIDVIHEGLTDVEAKCIERSYRPERNIGWNLHVGGGLPPSRKGVDCSNTKLALSGENRTAAQKERAKKHSEYMKTRVPWNKGLKTSDSSRNGGWPKGKKRK